MLPNLNPSRLPEWDGLDRWTAGAMLLLALWFGWLAFSLETARPGFAERKTSVAAQAVSPEYGAKLKIAENLLSAGNMEQLINLLDEMVAAYPYQAEPFMLRADLHIRRQEPLAAMRAFRQGLDLNLDYLEKKSPLYQGKKIRNTVNEAEQVIQAVLAENPRDQMMREARNDLYYMRRKLAGGCGD